MSAVRVPNPVAEIVVGAEGQAKPKALHAAFKWLRARIPLGQAQFGGVSPFWIVTKHADIREISRQDSLFLSSERPINVCSIESERRVHELAGRSNYIITLLDLDGPEHRKNRYIAQRRFMPQNVRQLEERVRLIARAHLERMAAFGGECDFAQDIGQTYSLYVLLDLLGLPQICAEPVLRLTREFLSAQDPDLGRAGAPRTTATQRQVLSELWQHLKPFADERRAEPTDDLLSTIVNGRVDGELLGDENLMGYILLLILAGHDSTSYSAAGGVMGLCEFPGEFAKLRADPSLARGAADEAIRWTTPVRHFMRSAAADYELRGQTIAMGDWLMLAYPSANRDEEVFEEPDNFRIDRSPNPHLAFGYGAHLCLGQHLAKLETRILFEELGSRLNSLELAGPPALAEATGVGGPKRVPIRYTFA